LGYPGGAGATKGRVCSTHKNLHDLSLHRCEAGEFLSPVNDTGAHSTKGIKYLILTSP